jgi:hypothetical protein
MSDLPIVYTPCSTDCFFAQTGSKVICVRMHSCGPPMLWEAAWTAPLSAAFGIGVLGVGFGFNLGSSVSVF